MSRLWLGVLAMRKRLIQNRINSHPAKSGITPGVSSVTITANTVKRHWRVVPIRVESRDRLIAGEVCQSICKSLAEVILLERCHLGVLAKTLSLKQVASAEMLSILAISKTPKHSLSVNTVLQHCCLHSHVALRCSPCQIKWPRRRSPNSPSNH